MKLWIIVWGVVGLVGAFLFVDRSVWLGIGGLALLAGAVYEVGRCHHREPLALLPASTDLHGAPLPPRWFCDRCGREWPAEFQKDQIPVQRFSGYDESKAVSAARRADQLRERQRHLALERAGLKTRTRTTAARAHAHGTDSVVHIGTRRSIAR
ncbi:MAG: hypothetical protein AMXMBFR57_32180 [Acidimicrobiia bacterium]|jgi:hypothetical protein